MIDREQFLNLFHAAQVANRPDYARSLAADWLAVWPGDASVQTELAKLEMDQKLFGTAIERLQQLTLRDPENAAAHGLLADALSEGGDHARAEVHRACAGALKGRVPEIGRSPSWAHALFQAQAGLSAGQAASALQHAREVLLADLNTPLPTLLAIRAMLLDGDRAGAYGLAQSGRDRWPETVAFNVWLGQHYLDSGEVERGVDYLHRAAAEDPLAMVAERCLGSDHGYGNLWPQRLTIEQDRPLPSEVVAVLGDNRIGMASMGKAAQEAIPGTVEQTHGQPGEKARKGASQATDGSQPLAVSPSGDIIHASTVSAEPAVQAEAVTGDGTDLPKPQPGESFQGPNAGDAQTNPVGSQTSPEVAAAQQAVDQSAGRLNPRPGRSDEDKRAPTYIVLSSRTRLLQEFGKDTFKRIDDAVTQLTKAVRSRPGWAAYKFYDDDPACLSPFGLTPADPSNAWDVKHRLDDLDGVLARRGQMIGAVLIIGGDAIVPFHRLPNPTDDEDQEVPSDNPYTTKDENYFAPEWPVGRIPADNDADLIVHQLKMATDEHLLSRRAAGPLMHLRAWLLARLGRILRIGPRSLGYSASIWRKASMAVFRSIGEPGSMITSPPIEAASLPPVAYRPSVLSYYNLHGIADSAEWFGQRDPLRDSGSATEYPVALRPDDIVNGGRAPKIVFTEACYGANVLDKKVETAISLKFLASGTHVVVGSTKVSYGSVTPPLIAADLLGRRFWENLGRQMPAGEALRQAKLQLAADMHRSQGYLDGEDQKTLISFVLFGDPLYSPRQQAYAVGHKAVIRHKSRPQAMHTVCALGGPATGVEGLDTESRQRVKSIVSRYLPGMAGATCAIHPQHSACDSEDHVCPTHQLGLKSIPGGGERGTVVVTLSKHMSTGDLRHPHFARLTLDKTGKVLKLAVSR